MKKFNTIEVVTFVGILTCLVLLLTAGCSMKLARNSAADVRKCCDRVSAHTKEMDKFNRYCKVALFLANSENKKEVGSGVRKGARDAVNICKFVFDVETDEDLLAAGDEQDYYKVRSYIIKSPDGNGGWIHPQCDPADMHCEEF